MEKKEEKIFRDIVKILEQDVPQEALAEGNPTPEQEAIALIKQELDKAMEEGYGKGLADGMKGKVFNKVEIKEEAHIPKELIEKIREEGYEKGYEMGVKYGTTGNTLTDSDTEEFERLDKKERERFLKSIY